MPLTAGEKLGPYQVVSPLGAGGMGEVYKARDTRLDRTVAVKVLPDHIAKKTDARQRFEREARAVASLNHPNICTLFDIGDGYTWQWNFGIQREVFRGVLLETAYAGNGAHKLTGRDLPNQAFLDPDAAGPTTVLSRRPNPNIGDVSYVSSLDNSNYHG
ncbi:MAG: hypothetical protein FJW39_06160 [Acidobacteria bacterium]|nr:hypothetical protein [Acidobacteriota bacterium]